MNILFLFHSPIIPYKGGVQRVTDLLARELVLRGHKIIFLSTSIPPNDYHEFSGIQEYMSENVNNRELYLLQYKKILSKYNIEIIISQIATLETLFLLENTPSNIKKISVYHTSPFAVIDNERRVKRNLHSAVIKTILVKHVGILIPYIFRQYYKNSEIKLFSKILKVSDKLCLLSGKFIPVILKYLPEVGIQNIVAINNPNTFCLPERIFSDKENLILFVSRLSEVPKNVHEFIDMWHVLSKRNKDWKAYIIGDGPDRKYLENYAKKMQCSNLFFLGNQKNISEYYAKAKFVCMTSIYEGWGMVLTEGMAYGCIPCAYGSYEAVYDIIDNDNCGLVTTPFRPEEMANKLQTLIDDEDKRLLFSENARKKVRQFSVEKIVDQWESLFYSLKK